MERSDSSGPAGQPNSPYLFGHSDIAARRLAVLAKVFASSTVAFLRAVAPPAVELAVDLDCGPGLTTRLIADTLGCWRVVGIELSDDFVELARGLGDGRLGPRRVVQCALA